MFGEGVSLRSANAAQLPSMGMGGLPPKRPVGLSPNPVLAPIVLGSTRGQVALSPIKLSKAKRSRSKKMNSAALDMA
jgi:hypothetical protein